MKATSTRSTGTKTPPFAKVPVELLRSGIGVAPIAVWATLRSHVPGDTMMAWPKVETIAKECGCSERTVKRAIQTLRLSGWVSVKKRYGRSNAYLLHETPTIQSGQIDPISGAILARQN